jgi:LPXTG-motif cell wall-anchored protein
MPMRTISAACAFTAAVSLLVVPAAVPAFAADETYTVPLHQAADLPLTATSDGVEHASDCPVPAGEDGWHFVLPGSDAHFVKLTVTFDPGGEQVVTSFGPPSDKHAYVGSGPGAKLVSASAEVKGGAVDWFNLSHTCPATSSGSPSPSGSPKPSCSASPSGSASPSSTEPGGMSEGQSGGPSESPSASVSPSASASPPGGTGGPGGGLAETGAQVGGIAGVAGLLVAAGSMLVLRRRKATGQR